MKQQTLTYGKFTLEITEDKTHQPIFFQKKNFNDTAINKILKFAENQSGSQRGGLMVHKVNRNSRGQAVACISRFMPFGLQHTVVVVCHFGLMMYQSINEKNNLDMKASLEEALEAYEKVKNLNFVLFNFTDDKKHQMLIPFYPLVK